MMMESFCREVDMTLETMGLDFVLVAFEKLTCQRILELKLKTQAHLAQVDRFGVEVKANYETRTKRIEAR